MSTLLFNFGHNGDVILSRAGIAQAIEEHGRDFRLGCRPAHAYLWSDFGLPIETSENDMYGNRPGICLWFGRWNDILVTHGISYRTLIDSYNRQAPGVGASPLTLRAGQQYVPPFSGPEEEVKEPAIIVENGPCYSKQNGYDVNLWLPAALVRLPNHTFYCASDPGMVHERLVDCSKKNLTELSKISEKCVAVISKSSGVTMACELAVNAKKPRIVIAEPVPLPQVWDSSHHIMVIHDFHRFMESLSRLKTTP